MVHNESGFLCIRSICLKRKSILDVSIKEWGNRYHEIDKKAEGGRLSITPEQEWCKKINYTPCEYNTFGMTIKMNKSRLFKFLKD